MNVFYSDDERLYLQMLQDNISRMSNNSANAKTWLVTIVVAFLAIVCNIQTNDGWFLLGLIPIAIFWYLDSYYLNLERGLRNREQRYINLKKGLDVDNAQDIDGNLASALFDFKALDKCEDNVKLGYVRTGCMLFSKSVYPCYAAMSIVDILITILVVYHH